MFEQFDENEKNEVIKKTAGAEFERLKQLMSQIEGKKHKGQFFNWTDPKGGEAKLTIGTVEAQFIKKDDSTYYIRFGGLATFAAAAEQVEPETWLVTPDAYEGIFVWMLGTKRQTPEQLAEAIAVRLAGFYDGYEEAVSL
jgi:hypothetical protein